MRSEIDTSAIATARLGMRAYRTGDLDRIARLYADPDVTAYTKLGRQDRDQSRAILAGYVADWRRHGFGMRALLHKPDLAYAGECGLFLLANGEAALRYALFPDYWGRGLTVEAVIASADDAFARTDLPRLFSIVQTRNPGSVRVMDKLGWDVARTAKDGDVDLVIYRTTREQWLARDKRRDRG